MATIIHYVERLIDFSRQAGGIIVGNEKLVAQIVWPHHWVVQIILFLSIMMYCRGRDLTRVIGKEKMLRLFFRGPLPSGVLNKNDGFTASSGFLLEKQSTSARVSW